MIKLESAHIEWARGIARNLDIDFQRQNFSISGPNGSGKSAVIDAIEFALTGQIGRLSGSGTKGLSVSEHGPHVDKVKFPDASFVELKIYIPDLAKSATITRKFKTPSKVEISPSDDDIEAILKEVSVHPEIALSRRDIIRFILVESGKRSTEIQALLKLDRIGDTRRTLNTVYKRLRTKNNNAEANIISASDTLKLHLQVEDLTSETLLDIVNNNRKILDLTKINELKPETKVDEGIANVPKINEFNKESALRDINALIEMTNDFQDFCAVEIAEIISKLAKLESDPSLLSILKKQSFIETGIDFLDGPECPLCDIPWEDEDTLRRHLESKLTKSKDAKLISDSLSSLASKISLSLINILGFISPVKNLAIAENDTDFSDSLSKWETDLNDLKSKFIDTSGLFFIKNRLLSGLIKPPSSISFNLQSLYNKVEGKPDQSATVSSQTFLTTTQLRLDDHRKTIRVKEKTSAAENRAKIAYDLYCSISENSLNKLYREVETDFSIFYRQLNENDEETFTAKLIPSEAKLDLDVNFYDRGLFPPGAYHSEGHQDGMGVCLYLALMKNLFGDRFTFALLDDIVMSVDSGHRYEFCKLLMNHFRDTQFIITTHDRLWAEQMKSAGLVSSKTSIAFYSWTIDTGPLVDSNKGIWEEISLALEKGKVEIAASSLRHHLEYSSRHLADQIGANPQFRSDGNYDLGDLLPSVIGRMKKLLGKAADAAQTWDDDEQKQAAIKLKNALSSCSGASAVEQWAVNKAVHYNEWTNFGKKDFEPVVVSFRDLIERFRCEKCDSWIYITPKRGPLESLRCSCSKINFNLKIV
jgi:RecF/RecN/SMC family protein